MTKLEMFNNLPDLLEVNGKKYENSPALSIANGISYTYGKLSKLAIMNAGKLYRLDVQKGDRISSIS